MTKTLLREYNVPQNVWGKAICTANHLQNTLPTNSNEKTFYQLSTTSQPNLHYFRIFCCKAYASINKNKRQTLDDKAFEVVFVGYFNYSKSIPYLHKK